MQVQAPGVRWAKGQGIGGGGIFLEKEPFLRRCGPVYSLGDSWKGSGGYWNVLRQQGWQVRENQIRKIPVKGKKERGNRRGENGSKKVKIRQGHRRGIIRSKVSRLKTNDPLWDACGCSETALHVFIWTGNAGWKVSYKRTGRHSKNFKKCLRKDRSLL